MVRRPAQVTDGEQPGRGSGFGRDPADGSDPPELSLAVLECGEGEAQAHLAALTRIVEAADGGLQIAEVTSTCLAINIAAPTAVLPRLKAALELGGAAIIGSAPSGTSRITLILTLRKN